MKFGQLIRCRLRNPFLKNHSEIEVWILVPDLFCFFKKVYLR